MLVNVHEHSGCSLRELATRIHMDDPTGSRVLAALVRANLARMGEDPEDRRRLRAELTPAGKALAKKLVPIAAEVRGTIDSALEPGERETLRALLRKVLSHLDGRRESAQIKKASNR